MLTPLLAVVVPLLAAAPAPAAPAHQKVRVLVLDFKGVGVTPGEAALLRDAAASRLGKDEGLQVISAGEMKTLVDIEASKQAAGCDASAGAACLAEIAGALGADMILTGNVGKLGDSVVINLSLLEAKKAEAVARSTITAPSLDDALVKLGPEIDRLATRITGNGGGNTLLYAGAGVAGLGVVVAGLAAAWSLTLEATLEDVTAKPAAKQAALDQRFLALGAVAGGVVLVAVGGGLIAAAEME